MDFAYLLGIALFFILCASLAYGCHRLGGA